MAIVLADADNEARPGVEQEQDLHDFVAGRSVAVEDSSKHEEQEKKRLRRQ